MPAQTPVSVGTAFYSQNDTGPPLTRTLLNGDGTDIDLTNAETVTITIARQRDMHYYSPYRPIVDRADCEINDPRTEGSITWRPTTGDLSPPGSFDMIWEINFLDGTRQTVPAHTYEKVVITTKPGGFEQL
jgi:hypothetical protein